MGLGKQGEVAIEGVRNGEEGWYKEGMLEDRLTF